MWQHDAISGNVNSVAGVLWNFSKSNKLGQDRNANLHSDIIHSSCDKFFIILHKQIYPS